MGYLFDPDNWRWLFSGNNFLFLLRGFWINVQIALVAMVLSLTIGLVLALLRVSTRRLVSKVAGLWVDVWRNLPLIFIILYLFLVMPESWRDAYERWVPGWFPTAFQTPFFLAAVIGLTLYNSAVIAEIMRAGIVSLERGQGEAAAAIGLRHWQAMRLVILPQGLRRMVPATVSQLITLNKDTTLVSIIGIQEVMRHARIVSATSGSPFVGTGVEAPLLQVFLAVGIMFVIVNLTLSRLSRRLELRERRRTGVQVEKVEGLEDQLALQTSLSDER
ncbi:MAG: putative glutamate transport system permease protein GluD [Actinomycetia bacterium]|jgi:His/Glu/Gln/Arg/opine family amino acid ABC transporter permease subunit|nr:putative glutamate transport system permease protein GluD [Actinomycetes bacterium]